MVFNSQNSFAQLQSLNPPLNSHLTLYMLETFGVTVQLKSSYPPEDLIVQLRTNALNKFNPEGNWHSVDLTYQSQKLDSTYIFQGSFLPTSEGNYQFTYRVGLNNHVNQWQWAGKFWENGHLKIKPPSSAMTWTQGPSYVEVFPGVYVGNFIAACQAEELGIDAILNMASELTVILPDHSNVLYKKLGTLDGAQHPISDELLLEAIQWIDEQLAAGKKKILIHCRAGIGRSGSVGVAYCYYKNSLWSYREALHYAWSKKADIYPHKNLQDSLERLFPRNKNSENLLSQLTEGSE